MIKNDIFFLGAGFLSMIKISSNADFFETGFKVVLDRIGKLQNAAQIAGVTAEQVAKWRDGKAKPPFKAVVALANAADVSLDWLATGTESPEKTSGKPNKKELLHAIETVEETLSSAKKNLEPLKKAELILAIYDLFTSESKPSPAQIVGILSKII